MNIFNYINDNLYGIDGTPFGYSPSLTNCQVIDYAKRIGVQDNQVINLPFSPYFGNYFIKDGLLNKQGVPSYLSTFNLVNTANYSGAIAFSVSGTEIISHMGAGIFQRSTNSGITWSNLPSTSTTLPNFSTEYKNNYYDKCFAGSTSFAMYDGSNWANQNLTSYPMYGVTKSLTKPSDVMLVGVQGFLYTGYFVGISSSMPTAGGYNYKAVAGGIPNNNWMALSQDGKTTTFVSTGLSPNFNERTWTTPQQLFSSASWNVDLAIIQSSSLASSRYVAVGYSLISPKSPPAAELYVSSLIPDSQITNYNMNNLSWKKLGIPDGYWFKIANTASAIDRKTDIVYISENPDNPSAQNRGLVSSDFGESWDVINLPSGNGSKGSLLYLNKSTINGQPTIQWFVSNGRNRAGEPPARLYSGARFL